MSFKLAVVQMDCVLGDVDANLEHIDCLVCAAAAQGANVAVLPELATTGYFRRRPPGRAGGVHPRPNYRRTRQESPGATSVTSWPA